LRRPGRRIGPSESGAARPRAGWSVWPPAAADLDLRGPNPRALTPRSSWTTAARRSACSSNSIWPAPTWPIASRCVGAAHLIGGKTKPSNWLGDLSSARSNRDADPQVWYGWTRGDEPMDSPASVRRTFSRVRAKFSREVIMYVRLAVAMLLSAVPSTLTQAAGQQEKSQSARAAPAQSHMSSGRSQGGPSSSWRPWSSSYSPSRATLSGSRPAGQPSPYYGAPVGNGLPSADEPVSISEPSRTVPSPHSSLRPLRGPPPPRHVTAASRSTPSRRVADPEPVPPPRFFLRPVTRDRNESAQTRSAPQQERVQDQQQPQHQQSPQPGSPNPQLGMLGPVARPGIKVRVRAKSASTFSMTLIVRCREYDSKLRKRWSVSPWIEKAAISADNPVIAP
jgi:hypothetical protein